MEVYSRVHHKPLKRDAAEWDIASPTARLGEDLAETWGPKCHMCSPIAQFHWGQHDGWQAADRDVETATWLVSCFLVQDSVIVAKLLPIPGFGTLSQHRIARSEQKWIREPLRQNHTRFPRAVPLWGGGQGV